MLLELITDIHKPKYPKNGDNPTTYGAENDAIRTDHVGRSNHHGDFPHALSRVAK